MTEIYYIIVVVYFLYVVIPDVARSKWFEGIVFTGVYNPICVIPPGKKLIHIWPDGDYCCPENLWEYLWKSDDYTYSYIGENLTDDDINAGIDNGEIK